MKLLQYLSKIQNLCRRITPNMLLFICKSLQMENRLEEDDDAMKIYPIWSFKTCKILLKFALNELGSN